MIARTRCRSCLAEITWAITTGGKRTPFVRDPAGAWVIENGNALRYKAGAQLDLGDAPEPMPERWTSHFADCPDADEHRRDRR